MYSLSVTIFTKKINTLWCQTSNDSMPVPTVCISVRTQVSMLGPHYRCDGQNVAVTNYMDTAPAGCMSHKMSSDSIKREGS